MRPVATLDEGRHYADGMPLFVHEMIMDSARESADAFGTEAERIVVRDRLVQASLMGLALPLLDAAGEVAAAIHLQHAIDTLERDGPSGDEPQAGTGSIRDGMR